MVDDLWIDPADYQVELKEAVRILDFAGIRTSIYNHQLCVLDRSLWPFAVKSISDWKNEYHRPVNHAQQKTNVRWVLCFIGRSPEQRAPRDLEAPKVGHFR